MFFLRPVLRYAFIAATSVAALAGGSTWLLAGGVWSDSGVWDDAATWIDSSFSGTSDSTATVDSSTITADAA